MDTHLKYRGLTKVDPGTAGVCEETPFVFDIRHGKDIQLHLFSSTSRMNGEQHRPYDTTADKTSDYGYLYEAKEEVRIETLMRKNECIRNSPKVWQPVELASGQGRCVETGVAYQYSLVDKRAICLTLVGAS